MNGTIDNSTRSSQLISTVSSAKRERYNRGKTFGQKRIADDGETLQSATHVQPRRLGA